MDLHRETEELPGYALVIAESGPNTSGGNASEPVARIVQKLRKPHSPTRMEGRVNRLELLANRFFGAGPEKGKSENSRVVIGDLNGGPGWT